MNSAMSISFPVLHDLLTTGNSGDAVVLQARAAERPHRAICNFPACVKMGVSKIQGPPHIPPIYNNPSDKYPQYLKILMIRTAKRDPYLLETPQGVQPLVRRDLICFGRRRARCFMLPGPYLNL